MAKHTLSGNKAAKGKGFDGNKQNINRKGRPPVLFSDVNAALEKAGFKPVTPGQLKDAYERMLNLSYSELLLIAGKKLILNGDEVRENSSAPIILSKDADEYPFHLRQLAQGILSKKGFEYTQKLIDRAQGTPKQSVEHSGELNQVIKVNLKYD